MKLPIDAILLSRTTLTPGGSRRGAAQAAPRSREAPGPRPAAPGERGGWVKGARGGGAGAVLRPA